MTAKWDARWMEQAESLALWSKDPRTQVGAVLVRDRRRLSDGYNGLPPGVGDVPGRMRPPDKYLWTCHAEANAVATAARHGVSLAGATAYVTRPPCGPCTALLLAAGVARVVYREGPIHMDDRTFDVGRVMCLEAGVARELMP